MTGPLTAMLDVFRLSLETQAVISMRLWGLAGLWNVTKSEQRRMWDEKPAAFAKAWGAAQSAALRGQSPDVVMSAYMRPLTQRARANRKRLAGRGPAVSVHNSK